MKRDLTGTELDQKTKDNVTTTDNLPGKSVNLRTILKYRDTHVCSSQEKINIILILQKKR